MSLIVAPAGMLSNKADDMASISSSGQFIKQSSDLAGCLRIAAGLRLLQAGAQCLLRGGYITGFLQGPCLVKIRVAIVRIDRESTVEILDRALEFAGLGVLHRQAVETKR